MFKRTNILLFKDDDTLKKRIVRLTGDDITFKDVEGYRKDVIDVRTGREVVIDRMEKKMRFLDIIKQYELFFNQKLKIYDKKYIDGLVDLLSDNDYDYLKKRKELFKSKRKIPLYKTGRNFFKIKEMDKINHHKKFSKTDSVIRFNPHIKRTSRRKSTRIMLNTFDNEDTQLDAINKAVKLEKERLKTTSNLEKYKKGSIEERLLFRNKISKLRNNQLFNIKNDFPLNSNSNLNQNRIINISSLSKSNRENQKTNYTSYFNDSFKENSYIYKKITKAKKNLKNQKIRIFENIKKNPIIFKKPYSMLSDYYKNYKDSNNK